MKKLFTIATTILLASSSHLYAADTVVDILPQMTSSNSQQISGEATHQAIKLTPDKSELIRLDRDAASIIVGNPAHINVIADSPRTLIIVPREPGATHFTILDKNSQTIMQRHVIVASPTKDYIRIKRTCANDAKNCQNTSVFYCPDMCHEIKIDNGEEKITPQAETSSTNDNSGTAQPINGKENPNNDNKSDNDDIFEGNE